MLLNTRKNIIIVIVFFVFILLYYLKTFTYLEKIASLIFHPIQKTVSQQSTNINDYIHSTAISKQSLLKKNVELQQTINKLNYEISTCQATKKENKTLRQILNFQKQNHYNFTLASTIQKNHLETEKSIVIDKGYRDKIQPGDAVIIENGILIGRIYKTNAYTSIVQLTVDMGSNILATIENSQNNILGNLKGIQGTSLSLNLVPKNIQLSVGQKIVTNGIQDKIPANLYLGHITKIQIKENQIFNSATVAPAYMPENLNTVSVLSQNLQQSQ